MRGDKHKHPRRAVRYYRVHHAFREPFKVSTPAPRELDLLLMAQAESGPAQVLFDGNFLHALRLSR